MILQDLKHGAFADHFIGGIIIKDQVMGMLRGSQASQRSLQTCYRADTPRLCVARTSLSVALVEVYNLD